MEFTESESLLPTVAAPVQEVPTHLWGHKAQSFCSLHSLLGGTATAAAKADSTGDQACDQQDHTHGHHEDGPSGDFEDLREDITELHRPHVLQNTV